MKQYLASMRRVPGRIYLLDQVYLWGVKMCCGIKETVSGFNEKSSRQDLSA